MWREVMEQAWMKVREAGGWSREAAWMEMMEGKARRMGMSDGRR